MSESDLSNDESTRGLRGRLTELRVACQQVPLNLLAGRAGSFYIEHDTGRGEIGLSLWDSQVLITCPDLTAVMRNGDILPDVLQALLLYYLYTADGTHLSGRWVSFADLPGGRMYNTAYQGYSGDKLLKAFDPNLESFKMACLAAGGTPVNLGDAAFSFLPLPRVPLLVTYWLGDEDFPSSCKILFDAVATHYLPIDGCAILGGMLSSRIIKSKK